MISVNLSPLRCVFRFVCLHLCLRSVPGCDLHVLCLLMQLFSAKSRRRHAKASWFLGGVALVHNQSNNQFRRLCSVCVCVCVCVVCDTRARVCRWRTGPFVTHPCRRVCVRWPGDDFTGARLTPVRPEFRTEFHRNFRQARHEESPERHVQLASRDTSAVNR